MADPGTLKLRRDTARNRASILQAARELFALDGVNVALEDVARAAGLSRTTLFRHFPDRTDLIAALWEADVVRIEALSDSVRDRPDGLIVVFDHVLGQQVDRRALHPTPDQLASPELLRLVSRIETAVERLLLTAVAVGVARDDLVLDDVMTAIDMCASRVTMADARDERLAAWHRVRRLVLPGLLSPAWALEHPTVLTK